MEEKATERSPLRGRCGVKRVVGIEGLRPLLTLHVIAMHWPYSGKVASTLAPRMEQYFLHATQGGYVAVELFLVMSGFVMGIAGWKQQQQQEATTTTTTRPSSSPDDEKPRLSSLISKSLPPLEDSPKPLPSSKWPRLSFFAKRTARLAPTYFSAWLATFLIFTRMMPKNCRGRFGPRYVIFADLFMAQAWLPLDYSKTATWIQCHPTVAYVPFMINGPLWYVSSLVGCYAIYALLAPLIFPLVLEEEDNEENQDYYSYYSNSSQKTLTNRRRESSSPKNCILAAGFLSLLRGSLVTWAIMKPDQRYGLVSVPGLLKHFPPLASLGFLAGAFTGNAARILSQKEESLLQWRGWAAVDSLLLFTVLFFLLFTNFAASLCPLFCLFVFATYCETQGPVLRALAHPSLVALAPCTYAAYAFLTPFRAALQYSGFDLAMVSVYGWYLVLLVVFAVLWENYLDVRARTYLAKNLNARIFLCDHDITDTRTKNTKDILTSSSFSSFPIVSSASSAPANCSNKQQTSSYASYSSPTLLSNNFAGDRFASRPAYAVDLDFGAKPSKTNWLLPA